MIAVRNIHYSAGQVKLLEDVSFNVQPGELLAVIGANGAGKSTLLKLLCKEIPVSAGEIHIRQQPINSYKLDHLAKFRSVLAQSNTISISFKVHELVMMGRYPHFDNHPTEKDIQIVKAVMEETGITEFANRAYNTLPGGEEQRGELCRVIAQSNTISISFKVHELVMMGRYPHFDNHPTEKDIQIVKAVMEETGITEFANRAYNTLSGGEQQRVQLARVIAQIYDQPKGLLFLDEPTNGLDLLYQQQILSLARNLADRGYCVISILHDINFASRFADKVLILKKG